MKKALISAAALALALAAPAFAADGNQPPNPAGQTFEQRQAFILKMLDTRINSLQEAKVCTQAAKSDNDLRACRQKHVAEMQEQRQEMRPLRGQRRPQGGMMGPDGQGGMMGGPQSQ
jgi:hypothetical protein